MLARTLCLLACLAGSGPAAGLRQDGIAGTWQGDIVTPQGPLEAWIRIEPDGAGGWTGTADTPTQAAWGIPLSTVEFDEDGAFAMEIALTGARFEAQLEDETHLVGLWKQNGASLPLACERQPADPPIPPDLRASATGIWEGVLAAGAVELRLRLTLVEHGEGGLRGTFQSPDQGPQEYAVTRCDPLADRRLRVAVGSLVTVLELGPTDEGGVLEGTFRQGGVALPIRLEQVARPTVLARPQEPQPPFPYRSEEVSYPGGGPGVTLAGTLTLPAGAGPHPAALLISGSGAQDRDETIFEHKPFWVLADALTRRGIAVLRVDDRGVGGSTAGADLGAATSADFADDVRAGLAFLRARPELDAVGLIGHSEGGLIAPLVAAGDPQVAFVVMLAGPGVPGVELLYMQAEAIGRAEGTDEDELRAGLALQRRLMDIVADTSLAPEETTARLRAALESDPALAASAAREHEIAQAAGELEVPWLRWFVRHDPAPVLARVSCPLLALNGGLDLQVPAGPNLEAIRATLEQAEHPDFTVQEMDGLNHLFQHARTGQVTEYGRIEETFAPEALERIGSWLAERFVH